MSDATERIRTTGCYVIKAAEGRPRLPDDFPTRRGTPAVVTDRDRAIVRALVGLKKVRGR